MTWHKHGIFVLDKQIFLSTYVHRKKNCLFPLSLHTLCPLSIFFSLSVFFYFFQEEELIMHLHTLRTMLTHMYFFKLPQSFTTRDRNSWKASLFKKEQFTWCTVLTHATQSEGTKELQKWLRQWCWKLLTVPKHFLLGPCWKWDCTYLQVYPERMTFVQ